NGSISPVGADVLGVNFETAPTRLELSGNYGRHVITVTGRRPSAAWETIDVRPDVSITRSAADEQINLVTLSVPVRAKVDIWYRFRRYWFPVLVLFVALGAQGVLGAWDTISKYHALWVVAFFAAALGSTAVVYIRRD